MASNNSSYLATNTMTLANYGLLLLCTLPAGVSIKSATNNGNGTVTVVFSGTALGSWAAPTPVNCLVGLLTGFNVVITPTGSPTSSSSGL